MTALVFLLGFLLGGSTAAPPSEKAIVEVSFHPHEVSLTRGDDWQGFVVQGRAHDGTTFDLGDRASVAPQDPSLIRIERDQIFPLANGQTSLRVEYGGHFFDVPVAVRDVEKHPPRSFRRDVMPALTKAGCNTGTCHGSAKGQDGFGLSLFGFDPQGDHRRITREMGSRRVNLALPEESLLIEKAIGAVPHTGGQRMAHGSELYHTLVDWLEQGARADSADLPSPTSLSLSPPSAVLEGADTTQRLVAVAHYSDGSTRDVTRLAVFITSNDNSASVDAYGTITAKNPGEAFVMARFGAFTVGMDVIVVPEGPPPSGVEFEAFNEVDSLIYEKLKRLRIAPSEVCRDEVFLRRVFLDVIGKLPTREDYEAFMADERPDKRARLVDTLLERKEFSELWVMKWAELLQIRTDVQNQMSYKATLSYFNWLKERIAENVPFDEIARELLSSTGGTFTVPATNFYQVERDTLKVAENVAQVFLGMRIQCAQCHNHPFDRWTMDDYYGFASFFSQIGRKRAEDPREVVVFNRGRGEVNHPVTNKPLPPRFLGGEVPDVRRKDRRVVLADWLTAKDNPYFGVNLVNRVWEHFFGRGLVHEVDDFRVSNPPSQPRLLSYLAESFVESGYDFKELVRTLCASRTYQLATTPHSSAAHDTRNFASATVRRIRAEVLLDAISQVTETPNKFRGLPRGARAVQIADGNVGNYFLTTFGRTRRTTVCSCEVKLEPNLSQALHLLNGPNTGKRIRDGGLIAKRLKEGKSPKEIADELYVRCLSRMPTEEEWLNISEILQEDAEKAKEGLEDVFWALLNSKEMMFNH